MTSPGNLNDAERPILSLPTVLSTLTDVPAVKMKRNLSTALGHQIKTKVAKPAQFLAKIRVEDIRQAEMKVDDRRRTVRQAESKNENRKAELDRREAAVETCEKRAREIAAKRKDLNSQDSVLSQQEHTYAALEKQQSSIEDEAINITSDSTLINVIEDNMTASDAQFERRFHQLQSNQSVRLKSKQQLESEIERIRIEVTNLRADVQENITAATATSAALASTIELREVEVRQQQQHISQARKVLESRNTSLEGLEEQWATTDRFLKDKYTLIEKTKRELKWSEDSYTVKRKSLRDLHDEYYSCRYNLEEVHTQYLKVVAQLERNRISIEQDAVKRRNASHDLERDQSQLAEQKTSLLELEKKKKEIKNRLLAEEIKLQKELQGLNGRTTAAVEVMRKLNMWKKEVKDLQSSITNQYDQLSGKEHEMTDWFRSLSWLGVQSSNYDVSLLSPDNLITKSPLQKIQPLEAVDLVSGLIQSHARKTKLAYLTSSNLNHRLPRKSKSSVRMKDCTNERVTDMMNISDTFINAMSQLRFNETGQPTQQSLRFTIEEKKFLTECLHHETLLKHSLHLPKLMLRCPMLESSVGVLPARSLINSLKAWWAVITTHAGTRELRILAARESLLKQLTAGVNQPTVRTRVVSEGESCGSQDKDQTQSSQNSNCELSNQTTSDTSVQSIPRKQLRPSNRLRLSTVDDYLTLPPPLTEFYLPIFPGQIHSPKGAVRFPRNSCLPGQ